MAASATDYFMKTGKSTATTLSAPGYTIGNTSINVGTTAELPTTTGIFIMIDEVETVGGVEQRVAGTYNVFRGTVATGTSINNLVYVGGDANRNYSAGATTRVYMTVSSYHTNRLIDGLLTSIDQDGTLKAGAVDNTAVLADSIVTRAKLATALTSEINTDWKAGLLPAVSSVTENGNRSADITFASTVASILTPGMRIRTSRTVAAPTYMGGAFNGTNHYFTKTTPTSTLSTVANNITLMAHVEPTTYTSGGVIMGRADSTPNNGFGLSMESTGQIRLTIYNGGGANYRYVQTYQSVPLNKKTHVAATFASGTILIYLDGVSVPVTAAVTGGTAPTTIGTGGDFSIGRLGAFTTNGYWNGGYISGCGVFDAVLSAATILSYKNQALTGAETNCIGAWSLNNTGVNQQAAGTNDLTATNSVGYTARSPYTTDANGTASGTYDWAIVTKVATTVATVQYPEGCAIPTSGGISTVDYSGSNAFGFPKEEDRWELLYINKSQASHTSPTSAVWYSLTAATVQGSAYLTVPVGKWILGYDGTFQLNATAGALNIFATLSTANNSESDPMYTSYAENSSLAIIGSSFYKRRPLPSAITTATPYYLNTRITAGSTPSIYNRGDIKPTIIFALPAYL